MSRNPEVSAVAKFGGDAMKPATIPHVVEIAAHTNRSVITPSAPFGVTDNLEKFVSTGNDTHLAPVYETFAEAADATKDASARSVADDAIAELRELKPFKPSHRHRVLSAGERFSGRLLAQVLDVPYVEPLQFSSDDPKQIDKRRTTEHLTLALRMSSKIVAAAFFGYTPRGEIITLGRNESDTSGAIFTNLSGSKLYENWKGVDGIFEADPKVVPGANKIPDITYTETRETGGKFLHRNAVLWLEKNGITTHIRPFEQPDQDGTLIKDTREIDPSELIRTIASAPNMRYFRIHQTGMNEEHGVIDSVTRFFDRNGLSVDHVPSGIDSIAVVADNGQFDNEGKRNLGTFNRELQSHLPEGATMSTKHVALIYLVGHGTEHNGHLAKVEYRRAGALIEANIPLLGSESQPESPMSFLMVPPGQATAAVVALHEAFFGSISN